MAYDLFLQGPPGKLFSLDEQKRLFDAFLRETQLDKLCEITVFGPQPLRGTSRRLERMFVEGEFARDEFKAFCRKNSLSPMGDETEADLAAQTFLAFKWGQYLFVPKMPHEYDEAQTAYRLIVEFARRHDLVLHDPQLGQNIDSNSSGDMPPLWGPRPKHKAPKRRWFFWKSSGS